MDAVKTNPTEDIVSTAKPRSLLPYLGLVALAEMIVLLRLLPNDLMWVRRIQGMRKERQARQSTRQIKRLMLNDPRLGAPAPPLPTVPPSHSPTNVPTVLIFIGACSSCQAKALIHWQRVYDKWRGKLNVVAVSRDTPENIALFRKYYKVTIPMLPDPDGRAARQYNAIWIPRVYGVRGGKVVYVEKDQSSMMPDDVARQLIGNKGGQK
jgi:hypothetical protein